MRNRRSMATLKALIFLGLASLTVSVHALQMGQMRSHSTIGERLNATLGLWLSPADKAHRIHFKISPDLAYLRNAKLTEIVNHMEARLEHSATGAPYVLISTNSPVSEPIVAFRLKVYAGDVAIMRNFALALNPGAAAQRPRAQTAPRQTRATGRASNGGPTVTVVRGDTLWRIARGIARTNGVNPAALVEQIFAANPRAFVDGDPDKLIAGARLNLSGAIAATAETPVTKVSHRRTSSAESPLATSSRPVALTTGVGSAGKKLRWQQHRPELAVELEALKEKYAALKARYDSQSPRTAVAATDPAAHSGAAVAPASSDLQASAESPSVTPTAQPVVQELQSQPPASSAPSAYNAGEGVTDEDVVMATDLQAVGSIFVPGPFLLIVGSALALGVIILITLKTRKAIVAIGYRRAEMRHNALEENRKADVARKAKNRIEVESEVKRMLEQRGDDRVLDQSRQVAAAAAPTLPAEDQDAEIDLNIAHGRYAEAENSLNNVITATPRNYSAKLRLIEVYYMTEKIDEFCQLADDLHHNHRADMADDEWRRVIRMGKIIAPNRPPFSGPRAVGKPTQAS